MPASSHILVFTNLAVVFSSGRANDRAVGERV